MKFRDHYFKRESTIADSDTVIIDINVDDPISYITVEYEATNGATSCLDHELHKDISKIELVDGSDVIASLDMASWRGLNFIESKVLPPSKLSEVGGAKQEESCVLHFGRTPDDPEMYLLPRQFKNLQLRLTHTLTISATAGFATGTGRITVRARIIEEGAKAHQGYLMAKEKYSWTTAGSGDEIVDLPRDHPYRLILIKALLTLKRPDEVISKLKLSIDADKYVAFDNFTEDILDVNERRLGLAQLEKHLLSADGGTALLSIFDIKKANIRPNVADHIPTIEAVLGERVTVGLIDMTTPATPAAQTTAQDLQVVIEGVAPHGIVGVFFGDEKEPEGWLPAPRFGDIKLIATQAAVGSAAIILQQLRS